MKEILATVGPMIILILMGNMFRRKEVLNDETVRRLLRLLGDVLIPCVIFQTVYKLELRREHALLTVTFFCFLAALLGVHFLVGRLLRIRRTFFPFFGCAFAFGLMALPMFSAMYGAENMEYLVAMGVGHELFFSLVYYTGLQLIYCRDLPGQKPWWRRLATPLLCLVLLGLFLNISGLDAVFENTIPGILFLGTTRQLAGITGVLTMLVIGYNLHFENLALVKESALYVLIRYILAFGLGYAFKWLLLDRLIGPDVNFDRAFFLLICQFGSTVLVMMVGKYDSQEDMEVSSNAFVLNVLACLLLGVGYYIMAR